MFQSTRLRLVLWNTAVVAAILALFAFIVYADMRTSLMNNVDRQTEQQLQPAIQALHNGIVPPGILQSGRRGQTSSPLTAPPLGVMLWQADGKLLSPPPAYLPKQDVALISHIALRGQSETVKLGVNQVRVVVLSLNANVQDIPTAIVQNAPGGAVYLVGLRNVDGIMHTLDELKRLVLTSAVLGLLLAGAAGFLLAYRAFVPIRRAWNKQVQFVADASHELRTPITAVQANAESLLSDQQNLTAQQQRMVSGIFSETRRLSRLLNYLLSLARMDADTEQLDIRQTDVFELTTEVAEQFRPLCEIDKVTFNIEIETRIQVALDSERMRQVLFNLLDNARKYTGANGAITLTCDATKKAVWWIVSDTGTGIKKEDVPLIFNRFYRGDASRQSGTGAGLGLSIVQWIVEAHGGSIQVVSNAGEGSAFTVTLPLRQPERK